MDKYERLDKLGEGGQGKVYKVRKKDDGRIVVLKMISCADPTYAQLAERETEIMRSLHHPHIIHLEESFRHTGRSGTWYCLVMEYCAGGDLFGKFRDAVQQRRRFAEKDLVQWIAQTASGLQYMHDRDLWHRDIKSANILFTATGILKLGDFGLSTSYSPQGHKSVVGTPFYYAPEIMLSQEYSSKVDLWNLGVVMLELLTFRQRPVNCEVLQDEKKPEKLLQEMVREGYSRKISMLIANMLSRYPAARPSAKEVLQQVEGSEGMLDGTTFAAGEAELRGALANFPGLGRPPQPATQRRPAPVPGLRAAPLQQRHDSNPGHAPGPRANDFNSPRIHAAAEKRSHTPTEWRNRMSPQTGTSPDHSYRARGAGGAAAPTARSGGAAAPAGLPPPPGAGGAQQQLVLPGGAAGGGNTVRQVVAHYDHHHQGQPQRGQDPKSPAMGIGNMTGFTPAPAAPRPHPQPQPQPQLAGKTTTSSGGRGSGTPGLPTTPPPYHSPGPGSLAASPASPPLRGGHADPQPAAAAAPAAWQMPPPARGAPQPDRQQSPTAQQPAPFPLTHQAGGWQSPQVATAGSPAHPPQPPQSPQSPPVAAPPAAPAWARSPPQQQSPAQTVEPRVYNGPPPAPLAAAGGAVGGSLQGEDAAMQRAGGSAAPAAAARQAAAAKGGAAPQPPRGLGNMEMLQLQERLQRLQQRQ